MHFNKRVPIIPKVLVLTWVFCVFEGYCEGGGGGGGGGGGVVDAKDM